MKRIKYLLFVLCITSFCNIYGQETKMPMDSVAKMEQEAMERAAVKKKVETAERKEAKAQKEKEKAEKERKKLKNLEGSIASKEKSISNDERKVIKLEEKLFNGERKGTLSPVDIKKIKDKTQKLKLNMEKDKGKLQKLRKKL
jgi:uncharacterized protein (DUF3084 family)